MPLLSNAGLATDIRAAERAIVTATGVDPRPWFRCPFGAGTDDPRRPGAASSASAIARSAGTSTAPTGARARRGRGMARQIVADAVARGDGAIVLLHPWTTATGLGLAPLIDGLRDAGRRVRAAWTRWA